MALWCDSNVRVHEDALEVLERMGRGSEEALQALEAERAQLALLRLNFRDTQVLNGKEKDQLEVRTQAPSFTAASMIYMSSLAIRTGLRVSDVCIIPP